MKRNLFNALIAFTLISSLSSCATVFGGRVTEAQRTAPLPGEPSRAIRPVAMIANIVLFWPGLIVDFATGAIYKPEGKSTVTKKVETSGKETTVTVTTTTIKAN